MKRSLLILVITFLACVISGAVAYYMRIQQSPAEWLGRKLGLEGSRLAEFTAAHNEYAVACAEMCRRIEDVNDELAEHVKNERGMTPAITASLSRAEALRAECKRNMLAHFMEVAKLLDEEKQSEYMQLVLPLITEGDRMEASHDHHHP